MLDNFFSPARLYVHKEHETLCHNVLFFFHQLNTKNAVNEQTQRPSINPGDKGDQHAASCLGQVGVYSEQVIQEVNRGVVQIQPILGWNLYFNVIVKNGTTWQSRKDLLPFSVSANLIPAENISHLQFLRPIFLLTLTIIFYHVVPKSRRKICCCYCCCNLVAVQLANISRTQIPSFDNLLFVVRHLIFLPTYHGILLQGNGMAVKISHEGEMGSETIPLTKVVSITLGRLAHLGSHNSVKPRGKMQRLTRATFLWDGMWRSAQA